MLPLTWEAAAGLSIDLGPAARRAGLLAGCRECGNDDGPHDGLCLDCLEAQDVPAALR